MRSTDRTEWVRWTEPTTIEAEADRRARNKLLRWFPDSGPYRRELYKPHLEFFAAGAKFRTRVFLAGNRCGKTVAGAYELTLHLTGWYPHWWEGKRFHGPIRAIAASDTGKLTREVVQNELLGPPGRFGTGMIPYDSLERSTMRSGVTDAVDTCYVKHAAGGYSTLIFKSYEQKRESFQGLTLEYAWMDEETPEAIFDEVLTRTATTNGVLALTFTPLQGLTPLIQRFLPGGIQV
jgi:phage terminase large subunit-like protein